MDDTYVCDLCHEETDRLYPWLAYRVCQECFDYGLYYDSLDPDQRVAEEASLEHYARHEAGEGTCNCQHRHTP